MKARFYSEQKQENESSIYPYTAIDPCEESTMTWSDMTEQEARIKVGK